MPCFELFQSLKFATKIIRSGSQLVYVRYCINLTVGKSKKDRILPSEVVVFKV